MQENAFLSGLLSNLQNVGLGRQPIPGWDKMRPIILWKSWQKPAPANWTPATRSITLPRAGI